jgi:hypothetical protein
MIAQIKKSNSDLNLRILRNTNTFDEGILVSNLNKTFLL